MGGLVITSFPNGDRYTRSGGHFSKMRNCDLHVLAARADFGVISDVGKVSTSKQDSGDIELVTLEMP